MTTLKKLLAILLLLTYNISYGQNLVPNGDFEQYWSCPANQGQIDSAKFWITPSTSGTPDYFSQCANGSLAGVPNNFGFQQAHSGDSYAGITLKQFTNFREYIEVPLNTALIANSCYHFEMHLNLLNYCNSATNSIGVYLSDTIISGVNNFNPLPFVPQINNTTGFITDTLNWTLISGSYNAHGGERYLIIGNFNDDLHSASILVNSSGSQITYYYIDDVSLTICQSNGLTNDNNTVQTEIFPNPVTDNLTINIYNNEQSEIILYDMSSRKLLQQTFKNSTTINLEQFARGIYFYEVRSKYGIIKNGKVIKE
jgi:OOP family OmpA-OmpF porin